MDPRSVTKMSGDDASVAESAARFVNLRGERSLKIVIPAKAGIRGALNHPKRHSCESGNP